MEIVHTLTVSRRNPLCPELIEMGGKLAGTICTLFVGENDEKFSFVENWANTHRLVLKRGGALFSPAEIDGASWLEIGVSAFSYPEPQNDYSVIFGVAACSKCRVGAQDIPRTLSRRPTAKQRLFGTNWLHDDLFAANEVWEETFQPIGIESRPFYGLNGKPVDTHVQLIIETQANIDISQTEFEDCDSCGQRKYGFDRFNFFPRLKNEPTLPIVRTKQWFGSGGTAFHPILINQELRKKFNQQRFKIGYWPLSEPRK